MSVFHSIALCFQHHFVYLVAELSKAKCCAWTSFLLFYASYYFRKTYLVKIQCIYCSGVSKNSTHFPVSAHFLYLPFVRKIFIYVPLQSRFKSICGMIFVPSAIWAQQLYLEKFSVL